MAAPYLDFLGETPDEDEERMRQEQAAATNSPEARAAQAEAARRQAAFEAVGKEAQRNLPGGTNSLRGQFYSQNPQYNLPVRPMPKPL